MVREAAHGDMDYAIRAREGGRTILRVRQGLLPEFGRAGPARRRLPGDLRSRAELSARPCGRFPAQQDSPARDLHRPRPAWIARHRAGAAHRVATDLQPAGLQRPVDRNSALARSGLRATRTSVLTRTARKMPTVSRPDTSRARRSERARRTRIIPIGARTTAAAARTCFTWDCASSCRVTREDVQGASTLCTPPPHSA